MRGIGLFVWSVSESCETESNWIRLILYGAIIEPSDCSIEKSMVSLIKSLVDPFV